MSTFVKDDKRRLVPRWRSVGTTVDSGELDATPRARDADWLLEQPDYLTKKIDDWHDNRTPIFASDLVAAGVVLNRADEVRDAATFILEHPDDVSEPARRLATKVMGEDTAGDADSLYLDSPGLVDQDGREKLRTHPIRGAIHTLRRRLAEHSRNPLGWVELARYYTIIGEDEQAKRAMNAAVMLSPNSRFVLRSASRFWVHQNDADYAHTLLKRSARTREDPWLLSAEIAIADVAGRTSRLVKQGRALLESQDFARAHITELAGSLASLELDAGKIKSARRLFAAALEQPNDNTVAQAEWASRRTPEIQVEQRLLETPRSYEARAWESFVGSDWTEALKQSWEWFKDEPFSRRPIALGTHVAAVGLEDYEAAEKLARTWLVTNPDDQLVLNNLAFALASAGRVDEAAQVLKCRKLDEAEESTKIAWTATEGLIRFRQGRTEPGRMLYERAVDMAKSAKFSSMEILATAFWAREEILAGGSRGVALVEAVKHAAEPADAGAVSIRVLRDRLTKLLRRRTPS